MDTRRIKRVRRTDRIATGVITIGGIGVIISVVGILLLIFKEALPLFGAPESAPLAVQQADQHQRDAIWVIPGSYQEQVVLLDRAGNVNTLHIGSTREADSSSLAPPSPGAKIAHIDYAGSERFSCTWEGGHIDIYELDLKTSYDADGKRSLKYSLEKVTSIPPVGSSEPRYRTARVDTDGGITVAQLIEINTIDVTKTIREENFLGEVTEESETFSLTTGLDGSEITTVTMDKDGQKIYAGTDNGYLLGWQLRSDRAELLDRVQIGTLNAGVSALQFILGEESIAVGLEDGKLSVWSLVKKEGSGQALMKLHDLEGHETTIEKLYPSPRHRSILSLDRFGSLQFSHVTSSRLLYRFPDLDIRQFGLSAKADTLALITRDNQLKLFDLHNPHPETSAKTLFGKVWYESYPEPEFVWQSSAASDDFEPKLSIVPLVFGSIKATLYAMLFSVPLALLGALYTSQFTTYRIKGFIKPTVEIMAAIPSVVVGFLAALWFAPLVEKNLSGFFLSIGFIPVAVILAILAWQAVRKCKALEWVEKGYEFLIIIPFILVAVALAGSFGFWLEDAAFDGNLKLWLYKSGGIIYDPRNSIIIAFALGFAVIPIIFTIAEDAFSNVPNGLRAASLALGASRWQTVWRVILPSASPGIFAAIVIGLGRAVGETMIVLMATGNTPIMDWSAFNGMRTLSANIAVEIPEAPHGGTLYRVLFLSAVILFVMTFVLNTGAEIVRQRLRKKYGQFQ